MVTGAHEGGNQTDWQSVFFRTCSGKRLGGSTNKSEDEMAEHEHPDADVERHE
jgi:hypothetical protein